MDDMSRTQHRLSGSQHRVGLTKVDHRWRQLAQAPVVMLVVLPMEELAVIPGGSMTEGGARA